MSELNNLLMMFIKDGYSASGKVSKKTAMAMMRFVGADKKLQSHVNSSDWKSVLNHDATTSGWISVDDKLPTVKKKSVPVHIQVYVVGQTNVHEWVTATDYHKATGFESCGGRVTHWMPLPSPPAN